MLCVCGVRVLDFKGIIFLENVLYETRKGVEQLFQYELIPIRKHVDEWSNLLYYNSRFSNAFTDVEFVVNLGLCLQSAFCLMYE